MNNVAITQTLRTVNVDFEVTGADPIQLDYRKPRIIPEFVTVTVVDGVWSRAVVRGPRVRKDGSPSRTMSETSVSCTLVREEYPMPTWLAELVESCQDREITE